MKFFCVRTNQNTNNSRFIDMLKIVLQTPPQLRTDDDHNKVFAYFNQDIYLNTFERTRGVPKMMLAISVLQGIRVNTPSDLMDMIEQIQYLVVIEGGLKTDTQTYHEKSCLLEKDLARISNVKVGTDGCFVAYLTRESYRKLLEFKLGEIKQILESLKKFSLFSQISHIHLLFLAAHTVTETYRFRQFIYKFGEESTYVYCIIYGPFEMIRRFKKQKANYESSITSIEGGQTFGEDCVFLKCNRESEIRCLSCDNSVYKMPSECLVEVYNEYPKLKDQLVLTISERRAYIEKRAVEIAETHTNPLKGSLKNSSMHEVSSVIFPKLREHISNREKTEMKLLAKQKTHEEVGMELFAKAFNFNESSLLATQKIAKSSSKQNILRTLGVSYLVPKLHSKDQHSKSIFNRSGISVSQAEDDIKDSFIQLPLMNEIHPSHKARKAQRKYQRFKIKHRFVDQGVEPHSNHSMEVSLKRIFSLDY